MLSAWPNREKWKPETVDNNAYKLECKNEIKTRISTLKRIAAERAITTRANVLAGMSETFDESVKRVKRTEEENQLDYVAVNAVTNIGKTLLDSLPEEQPEDRGEFVRDFALLIGKDYMRPHR